MTIEEYLELFVKCMIGGMFLSGIPVLLSVPVLAFYKIIKS